MTTSAYSFIPVHPGEIIKEELQARGVSQKRLAELLGVQYTMLNEILNGKRQLSTEMAIMIEAAMDINADMLVGIQSRYDIQTARKSSRLISRCASIGRRIGAAVL